MSVRINLEIGHEASVRTKHTPDGFTHDWEVFVRGTDNANIQSFIDKVVFVLHDTFKNPKRVKKEPPYTVKESGYAGFIILIEIHLRSKEEPKKLKFQYDLTLQKHGPPIYKFQKEKFIFNAPSEEFKQKLLKGGGFVVANSQENARENRTSSEEKSQLISKPRLSGSDYIKKHKPPKIESNNFQELFGTPINKTSKPVETKPIPKEKSNTNSSNIKPGPSEKDKVKHSPYKDKEKEKDRERFKEKGDFNKKDKDEKRKDDRKERSKDREKKERRDKSPRRSPTPSKKSSSPKRPPSPLSKYKDEKKVEVQKKNGDDFKEKSEKKIKKEKRDKDKERHESKRKDNQKISDQKEKNFNNKDKLAETNDTLLTSKLDKKDKINIKDFVKETENGKIKPDKMEDKPKHKHKKKDKVRDKASDKEKSYKSEKKVDKGVAKDIPKQPEKQISLFDSPKENKKTEKSMQVALTESIDTDASNSSISSPETSFNDQSSKSESKYEHTLLPLPTLSLHPPSPPVLENQKLEKQKREKIKKNKDKKTEKDPERKRKRKSEQKQTEEPLQKVSKDELLNLNNISKESDSETPQPESEIRRAASEQSEENCEDYMNILRDLQQKILTLQDNSELQKVVELIAETGRYEVSAQTFDFDLCLLERSTISQLQNFFETTS